MSTPYRPIDSKREEFRKYLERSGVMDALTRSLVMLYEEVDKPTDALDYVRKNMGDNRPDLAEFEALKQELEDMLLRVEALTAEKNALKERLEVYEPAVAEGEGVAPTEAPPAGAQSPKAEGEAAA